jgi:hypothetical protein
LEGVMMEDSYSIADQNSRKSPEARYAYYRRCQVFRRSGEQCKAPAEKGSGICYAHAGQQAMTLRRERERRAVLAEAIAQIRKQGRPDFEAKDLFMDFKSIQVTLAVMAQALIDGRIDCKTAGKLLVELQTVSKILRMVHRKKQKHLPLINTDDSDRKVGERNLFPLPQIHGAPGQVYADERRLSKQEELEETRIALVADIRSATSRGGLVHGPPRWIRAA